MLNSGNKYIFDWPQMKQWNLTEEMLPIGSIVINQPPSLYTQFKVQLWWLAFIILALTLLSIAQLWKSLIQRKAYLELENLVHERTVELESANERLEVMTVTDPLTGLANRRKFEEFLRQEHARAKRSNLPLSLLFIDNFKLYNDHYGHQSGDNCLQKVSEILKENSRRAGDLAARFGGEEFVVILTDTSLERASEIAEKIRLSVQSLNLPHELSEYKNVTISIGIAEQQKGSVSFEELIKLADQQLYQAKENGRNCTSTTN